MLVTLFVAALLAGAPQETARAAPKPTATPVHFTVTGTFADGTSRVFLVTADRDSDNDGKNDEMDLRITCSGGAVSSSIVSPRDPASGMASGKRMHKPMMRSDGGITAMDDWSTRSIGKPVAASWDLATMKGARGTAGPKPITLVDVDPVVCSS